METFEDDSLTPASAADAISNDTPAALAAEASNGLPSTSAANHADDDEMSEEDVDRLLNEHGSKAPVGEGAVDLDKPIGKSAPAAGTGEEDQTAENDEVQPTAVTSATAAAPEPNSYRVNLKNATDRERKAAILGWLRDEPNIDSAEIARRLGGAPAIATAEAPAAPGTAAAETSAPSPTQTRLTEVRAKVAVVQEAKKKARDEFDYAAAFESDDELRPLEKELDRLEADEANEAARRAGAAYEKVVQDAAPHWKEIVGEYPDVNVEGSALHAAVQVRINDAQAKDPGFFAKNPDWPVTFTLAEARKLKLSPKAPAASAPAATAAKPNAAATAAPRKTFTPVAALPAGGSHAAPPNAEEVDWDDLESIDAALDKYGTKVTR